MAHYVYVPGGTLKPMAVATMQLLQEAAHQANLDSPPGTTVVDTSTSNPQPSKTLPAYSLTLVRRQFVV